MQRSINSLSGFTIGATDGEIGKVKEFYFDDETWAIRYLVIETGNWFFNKKVLIAPQALLAPDWENKNFPVNLTKEQIKNSPDIDTDKPISRQQEIELYGHYPWRSYWGNGFFAGGFGGYPGLFPIVDEEMIQETDTSDNHDDEDTHLRSTESISGYHIHATNGDIGHVKDFNIDVETWKITDLVIDTHNWIGGHKVLILVWHVKEIQWENSKVMLDISKEYLKDCPVFNENSFVYPQNIFEL